MPAHNHTIVRNVSGVQKFFSFLGANGVDLADGEDYAHPGDLFSRWMNDTLQTAALRYALDNNLLEILASPDVYLFDETAGRVRRIIVDDGDVLADDPDYGSYTGDAPDV